MSAAKHTPGPWQAAGKHIVQDDGGCVAYVTAYATVTPRQAADARLIAAAPDLLEALESFLRAPSVGSNGPGSSTIVVQEFNLRAARAAIAKATGGAS